MYARRHFLIRNEVAILRQGGKGVSTKEATSLLLFSIILESNEEDLIYAMMQEGAHKIIRDMMKEFPSLNKRYPILAAFTNKFWGAPSLTWGAGAASEERENAGKLTLISDNDHQYKWNQVLEET